MNPTNRQGLEEAKFSRDDWYNLLSISHRYGCEGVRQRSIREIDKLRPPVDDVEKIVMAKRFGVDGWLLPACVALVERSTPLTYVEAEKLGLGITVPLSEARETYIRQQQNGGHDSGSTSSSRSVSPIDRTNRSTRQLVMEIFKIEE